MDFTPQQLGDCEWPERWCVYARTYNDRGGTRVETGDAVKAERNGSLTYRCYCGEVFNRLPGEQVSAAREWVATHRAHVPGPVDEVGNVQGDA